MGSWENGFLKKDLEPVSWQLQLLWPPWSEPIPLLPHASWTIRLLAQAPWEFVRTVCTSWPSRLSAVPMTLCLCTLICPILNGQQVFILSYTRDTSRILPQADLTELSQRWPSFVATFPGRYSFLYVFNLVESTGFYFNFLNVIDRQQWVAFMQSTTLLSLSRAAQPEFSFSKTCVSYLAKISSSTALSRPFLLSWRK